MTVEHPQQLVLEFATELDGNVVVLPLSLSFSNLCICMIVMAGEMIAPENVTLAAYGFANDR
jgi:hypothetical protein